MAERAAGQGVQRSPQSASPGAAAAAAVPASSSSPSSSSSPLDAAAAAALDTSAASLQVLAQQQADYRRKLALLQHQQDLWQLMQQRQQQQQAAAASVASTATHAEDKSGGTPSGGLATKEDRMQHLHQTFQQRIMERQAARDASAAGSSASRQGDKQAPVAAASITPALLSLSMAAASTSRMASASTAPPTWSQQLEGAAVAASAAAAVAAARLTPQELERMRKEQLERIQQFQFQQALAAAKVDAQRRSGEELLRQQPAREQEALRAAQRAHEQQSPLALHVSGARLASPTELLTQQQHVLRQQQVLQGLLHKQQQERLLIQQQQQQQKQQQKQQANAAASAAPASSPASQQQPHLANSLQPPPASSPAAAGLSAATTPTPAPKRRRKSKLESQMEALVRALARINSARTSAETVLALDKMSAWVQRCLDVDVLRFAARDFPLIEASQRMKLTASSAWTVELQAKCASISGRIAQIITALQHPPPQVAAATASASSAPALAGSAASTLEISPEAREHAYATLKAQILYKQSRPKPPKKPASAATEASTGQKRAIQTDARTMAPDKKPRSESTAGAHASADGASAYGFRPQGTSAGAAPMSPREAQRVYELDLSMRTSASAGPDDADDRLYFPVKVIAKVMRKALPSEPSLSAPAASTAPPSAPTSLLEGRKVAKGEDSGDDERQQAARSSSDVVQGEGDDAGSVKTEADGATRAASPAPSSLPARLSMGPGAIKLSDDAVALVQECATEFLLFLTSEARDHAVLENPRKKPAACSVSGANVLDALRSVGLSPYATVLEVYNAKIRRMQDSAAQRKLERKLEKKQLAKQAAMDARQALERAQQTESAVTELVASMVAQVASGSTTAAAAVNAPSPSAPSRSVQAVTATETAAEQRPSASATASKAPATSADAAAT